VSYFTRSDTRRKGRQERKIKNTITTTYSVIKRKDISAKTGTIVSTHKSKIQAIQAMCSAKASLCVAYTGSASPLAHNTGMTISLERLANYLSFGDMRGGSYSRID
jgi:hypothetical protein